MPIKVADGVAHFSNVQLCGSVWACPVCAAKIRQVRAVELEAIMTLHQAAGGGLQTMLLSVPHGAGMGLEWLLDATAKAWSYITSGGGWKSLQSKFGVEGWVRALEITYSESNGWNPHFHVVLLTAEVLTDERREALGEALFRRWRKGVSKLGLRAPVRQANQMKEVRCASSMARYVTDALLVEDAGGQMRRVGQEVLRLDTKQGHSGMTPFELLTKFEQSGDDAHLQRWNEYEEATKGRRACTYSRGLKARYKLPERTDEQIAEAEAGGEVVAELTAWEFKELKSVRGGMAGALEAAERGGAVAVLAYLVGLGVVSRDTITAYV